MFASKDIFLKSSGGYQISRSVRLRASATAYFSRTNSNAPTNNKIGTLSMWLKRGALTNGTGNNQYVIETGTGSGGTVTDGTNFSFYFDSTTDKLIMGQYSWAGYSTTQVYRDPSAWYHIVISYNSTLASNNVSLYVNNVLQGTTSVVQNTNWAILNSGQEIDIGRHVSVNRPFDGYLTEINVIDGQALTPSSFGETNSVTGVWQPKKYAGTYGTNGFYLNFSDNSGVTATTIGKDYSGNGNNWTPSAGISITAGATYDSMLDVPTQWADGGNGRGNYAVLNPLNSVATISAGNLNYSSPSTAPAPVYSSIGMTSGKWYFEYTLTATNMFVGVWGNGNAGMLATGYPSYYWDIGASSAVGLTAEKTSGTSSGTLGNLAANDVYGIALDIDNTTVYFYKNNSLVQTVTGMVFVGPLFFVIGSWSGGTAASGAANFGQRPFTYTPPTGFVALNTQNLPAPTISNGASYMAATLYTGNGATGQSVVNTLNGVSFAPDFVWVKVRSAGATSHYLADTVRGATKYLQSNTTAVEGTNNGITAFNSNGFSVGAIGDTNSNAASIVGWQWNAGGSTVTNTSGTISSQVRANPTAGFSVVTYTGNGVTAATVGHGLNAIPAMVIIKERETAGTNWMVKHQSLASSNNLFLQGTNATTNITTAVAGGGIANLSSSTTFNFLAGTSNTDNVNRNTGTFVAYCFAAVAGYSAFGSYTGNNVADGPFVYLGFRPIFIMIKSTSASTEWVMIDTSRSSYNLSETSLYANRDYSESTIGTVNDIDILSNGFKLRNNTGFVNASQTYIYAAFSEVGFKYALGR